MHADTISREVFILLFYNVLSDFHVWAISLNLVALLFFWRVVLWQPRPLPGVTRPNTRLLGHRGVRQDDLPENSLAAFERALAAGLDGLECDVQRSADGILVCFHDFTLEDKQRVTALTLAQLRRVRPYIPRLEELLELVAGYPGVLLNIELKTRRLGLDGLERQVARVVRAAGLQGRVVVSSFNPLSLFRLRLVAPGMRVALLYAPGLPLLLRSGWLAGWLHVDALHPHESQVNQRLIARSARRGCAVNTWTVNDPARVASLVALGVQGIIGDDPDVLLAAARRAAPHSEK